MILAERSLLWWRTSEWETVGVWATALLTVFAVVFAVVQLRRAGLDRRETTRPFVQVDVDPRRFLVYLSIKNTGQSAAADVKIRFDEPPQRAQESGTAWLDAPALKDGIPLLAPGREVRFFFDSFIARKDSNLPIRYDGTVTYHAHHSRDQYEERFILDLEMYMESSVGDRTMDDLVEEVQKLRTEIAKWTESGHLKVLVQDREHRAERQSRWHHRKAMQELLDNEGRKAVVKYLVDTQAEKVRDRIGLPKRRKP